MSSISQLTTNSRSMNGLNTINANAVFTDSLEVNTLTIDTQGTAPTVSALSNDNNIATTAWVTAHAGGAYVTTNTTQTITGQKTFSNANTFITGNTVTNSIEPNGITTNVNIGTTQTTGVLDIGTLNARTGAINIGSGTSAKTITLNSSTVGTTTIRGQFAQLRPAVNGTCNIGDNMSSGTISIGRGDTNASTTAINIGTGSIYSGLISIGNGATATGDVRIANNRSGAGTVTIGSNASSTNILNLQSSEVNIGTVSPIGTTNDVNIGNGQLGSTIILNSETTCIDDLIVNNIKSTAGSMTIATDPVGYTDDITISTANDLTLNAGFNAVINCYQGSFGATNTFGFTSNGSGGMYFNENFGGTVGMNFNGTKISFNNSGLTQFAGSEVSINGGQLTVDAGPFVIKSGGSERLRVNYALGETTIQIKTDGDTINFSGSDNTLIMRLTDIFAPLYKKGSITVPNTTNFNLIPVGTILTTVTSTVPAGYLYCGGGLQSTTASSSNPYYELFLAIGYTYGGSGASFAIPDFRGMFLRGFGSQTAGGVTYQAGAVGAIQFDQALTTPLTGYATPFVSTGFRSCGSGTRDCLARTSQGDTPENPTGLNLAYPTGRGGTEVRPVSHAVYYYIKY